MTKMNCSGALACVVCLVVSAGSVAAQGATDAGALQQQIERDRQQRMPQRLAPDRPAPPAAMQATSGLTVTVKQFRFAGNTLLSSDRLAAATSGFLGRPIDFSQLQTAAAAVADVYRATGWVARAYLPAQEINEGMVTIQVIEAVFGGLRIEGGAPRISTEMLSRGIQMQQRVGDPLNTNALDRALLLADDLPGVAVSGTLVAGQREGETDIVYRISSEPLVISEVALDNAGSRATGDFRVTANAVLNSPKGVGDQASLSASLSQGNRYARLAYTLPAGDNGWRIGASASYLSYDLKDIDANGDSLAGGFEARYPVLRTRMLNLYLSLNAEHKHFNNSFNGATSRKYAIASVSAGLSGNRFDDFGGGGANSASLFLTGGRRDNSVGTTSDSYKKVRYSLARQQAATSDLVFYAAIEGQESRDDLDSAEAIYLGGPTGVRAYPANEGRGSSGSLGTVELRWRMPTGAGLAGFYDHGRVRNRDGTPTYSLRGAGLSLSWQNASGLSLRASLARRIGTNPNPTPAGKDQDGSLEKYRPWLSVSLSL